MDVAETAVRLATVSGLIGRVHAAGPPPRARATYGRMDVVDLGVDTPWSVQAYVPGDSLVQPAEIAEAVAWCRARGGERGFVVRVRAAQQDLLDGFGLVLQDQMEVFAMPASAALDAHADGPAELLVEEAQSRDELVAGYGGWMSDVPLARRLLGPDDFVNPRRRFLVGKVDTSVVGCALIWYVAGTAHLSGIGIVPELRRRGYGRALTTAATRLGAGGRGFGPRPDLVWMHATPEGAELYEALGFRHVDRHVLLGPA